MSEFTEQLKKALAFLEEEIPEEKLCKLERYYELLTEKNKVMNLTAITEPEEVIRKHFEDSLSVVCYSEAGKRLRLEPGLRLIDVGTGAGFPGMVLKIMYPETEVTLTDSLRKRLLFLEEAAEELKLGGIRIIHGRAEDLGHDRNHRGQYDLAVARAVAGLSTLTEYCLPFVRTGGTFIAYKSAETEEERKSAEKAVRILGGRVCRITAFELPGTGIARSFIEITKTAPTPAAYPRKAGTPAKEPLA